MLVLSRKENESVVINNDITITVVEIRDDKVRLGVVCPKHVPVHRQEVYDAIHGKWPPPRAPEEIGFLQRIGESPGDEAIRLVFADWLEERGDPLGEFIRIQCQLAKLALDDKQRNSLEARLAVLEAAHGNDWRHCVPAILLAPPTSATPLHQERLK